MFKKMIGLFAVVAVVGGGFVFIPQAREMVTPWLPSFLAPDTPAKTAAKGDAKGKKGGARTVPVRVAAAIQRSVPIRLEGVGIVKARSTVAVKSQIEGQLIEARVREGQTVKKGDVLFRLDARPLQARLKEANAVLTRDRIAHKKAVSDFNRLKILTSQGYSPQTRHDDGQALVNTTEAAVRASEAAVELANLNLNYATIQSPIDGRVGNLLISVGNIVKANDSLPLLVITETKPVYVSFNVPERYIDELREKMTGPQLNVEVTTASDSKTVANGNLFFINNEVDASTGTIELLAQFDNAAEKLVPGQFARASVLLSTLEDAVLVPTRAIQINQQGRFVWVMKKDKTVARRKVTLGPETGANIVVASGIDPGDVVVTDGQLRLVDGISVAPKGSEEKSKKGKPKNDIVAQEGQS